MVRIVSALFAFALLLCVWIVMRDTAAPTQVARASGSAELLSAPLTTPEAQPPAQPLIATPEALVSIAPPAEIAPAAPADPPVPAEPAEDTQRRATDSVLADLTRAQPTLPDVLLAQAGGSGDTVGQSALSGILAARGLNADTADSARPDLAQIVQQALDEGHPDSYVEALLKEAASEGVLQVSPALRTASGEVDTRTLLGQIVARAEADDSTDGVFVPTPDEAVTELDMTGVETRTVQRAEGTETYRFYTVQGGDSLGGIARRFYGDASYYIAIFEANRQILSSPDRIRAGQRLVIPAAER